MRGKDGPIGRAKNCKHKFSLKEIIRYEKCEKMNFNLFDKASTLSSCYSFKKKKKSFNSSLHLNSLEGFKEA